MANKVIMTMGVGSGDVMIEALALAAKRGRVVVTNIHPAMEMSASMSLLDLTLMEKQVVGSLFGSGNPRADIPKLLGLYREGQLDLDGHIIQRHALAGQNVALLQLFCAEDVTAVGQLFDLAFNQLAFAGGATGDVWSSCDGLV